METKQIIQTKPKKQSLLAFIYDIPKDENYTSQELTSIIKQLGLNGEVQIQRNGNVTKPFLSAMIKFESEAQLQLALANHRSFKLRDHKHARILPFDQELRRNIQDQQVISEKMYDPNDFDYKVLIQPEITTRKPSQ